MRNQFEESKNEHSLLVGSKILGDLYFDKTIECVNKSIEDLTDQLDSESDEAILPLIR